jgi:hypothetical protein
MNKFSTLKFKIDAIITQLYYFAIFNLVSQNSIQYIILLYNNSITLIKILYFVIVS